MKGYFKSIFIFLLFVFFSILLVRNISVFDANASNLGPLYFLFERMQVNQETDMILMFTPSTDFVDGGELKIRFLDDVQGWCPNAVEIDVVGIDASAIEQGDWQIDLPLPERTGFSFEAECIPGSLATGTYDTILIKNIGALDSDVSYGVKILKNPGFTTSHMTGEKSIFVELNDGINSERNQFGALLMQSDSLTVLAKVVNISTITCTVSNSSVSFNVLSKTSNYSTVQHSLTTTANLTEGYYWAAFGKGDGDIAGLWKSTSPTSLIPSPPNSTVNLLTNHGFGLVLSAPMGVILDDFISTNPGVFGGINSGYQQARLIFYEESPETSPLSMIVTLGARAGVASEAGGYSEIVTYLCGGFY